MKKQAMAFILVFIICFVSLAFFGCAQEKNSTQNSVTILAKVTGVNGGNLFVRGLTQGFEGEYTFGTAGVPVVREGEEQIAAEIEVGDVVSVTFGGGIAETRPGILMGVTKVIKMNG